MTGAHARSGSGGREVRLGPGWFVAIAGASGVGKDTLIAGLRRAHATDPRIVFARRIVTRDSDMHEDHDTMSADEFCACESAGEFLLSWRANGLSYGLPRLLEADIAAGRVVVANVSRAILPELSRRFERAKAIHITARPDVLAERLKGRAREDQTAQRQRILRAAEQDKAVVADVVIDNSGAMADALAALEAAVAALLPPHADATEA